MGSLQIRLKAWFVFWCATFLPDSMIFPVGLACLPSELITIIWSAFWMVLSLWAITKTVRPFINRWRASWTRRSDWAKMSQFTKIENVTYCLELMLPRLEWESLDSSKERLISVHQREKRKRQLTSNRDSLFLTYSSLLGLALWAIRLTAWQGYSSFPDERVVLIREGFNKVWCIR